MSGGKNFLMIRLLLNITLNETQTHINHVLDVKVKRNNVIINSKHGRKSIWLGKHNKYQGGTFVHKAEHQI